MLVSDVIILWECSCVLVEKCIADNECATSESAHLAEAHEEYLQKLLHKTLLADEHTAARLSEELPSGQGMQHELRYLLQLTLDLKPWIQSISKMVWSYFLSIHFLGLGVFSLASDYCKLYLADSVLCQYLNSDLNGVHGRYWHRVVVEVWDCLSPNPIIISQHQPCTTQYVRINQYNKTWSVILYRTTYN